MLDRYFYTYHNPAGNHFVRGSGSFPNVLAVDVPLHGRARLGGGLRHGNGRLACRAR